MKKLYTISGLILLVAGLLFVADSGNDAFAVNTRTFPAGSYILPVEPCWQPNNDPFGTSTTLPGTCDPNKDDRGIFNVYGMVYDLLDLGVPIYWAIKPDKVTRDDIDFSIVKSGSNPAVTITHSAKADTGTLTQVDYRGGPFVIDANDLTSDIQAQALNIINNIYLYAKVHKTQYDFTLNYDKVLSGTPPKVAVLGASSVSVLLQYLRASGLGNRMFNIFTEVSSDEIIGGALNDYQLLWAPHWVMDDGDGVDDSGDEVVPQAKRDQVLSAIRSFLEKGNAGFFECASIGSLEGSWDFLSPTAHSTRVIGRDSQTSGGFLTNKAYTFPRLDVNTHKITGLNQTDLTSIYTNDLVFENAPFYLAQCSGWKFIPSAGVLENMRPRHTAIPAQTTIPAAPSDHPAYPLSVNPYVYNTTVSRFVHDKDTYDYPTKQAPFPAGGTAPPGPPGMDYYVGGYINGGSRGYVAYLAGHQYVRCTNTGSLTPSERQFDIYFDRDISLSTNTLVTIEVKHSACAWGSTCPKITYDVDHPSDINSKDAYVYINAGGAVWDPVNKKISPITVGNLQATATTTITNIKVTFTNETLPPATNAAAKMTQIIDVTDDGALVMLCKNTSTGGITPTASPYTPSTCAPCLGGTTTIAPILPTSRGSCASSPYALGSLVTSCTMNWAIDSTYGSSNTCGIRYVLNTLMGLQFQVVPNEYAKAAPVVKDNVAYKATFEFPGWKGHLYAVDAQSGVKKWDAGDANVMPPGGLLNPATPSNTNATRYIFTNLPGTTTMVNFDDNNKATLDPLLDPAGTKTDNGVLALINEVRGRLVESEAVPQGTREVKKRLGGIERSTPAILRRSPAIQNSSGVIIDRDKIVFAGGNDGMLHAFYAGSWDANLNGGLGGYTTGTGKEFSIIHHSF